jgi:hypothetical protein
VYCFVRYWRVHLGHRTGHQEANRPGIKGTEVRQTKPGTKTMKTVIASTVIALNLLASGVSAAPYDSTSNVPQWAQKAFAARTN